MVRYVLQQPRTLERCAIKTLGDYIALQGEKLEALLSELHQSDAIKAEALFSRQIEFIRNRLNCNVPRMLYDKLLEEIIRAISSYFKNKRNSDTFVMGRMVETMFTKKLTRISLSYQDQILNSVCLKSYMLTGLIELSISYIKFSDSEIIQLLRELHNLRKLSFRGCSHYYSEDVLNCIVDNCTLIEDLDVSGTYLNDKCIVILTQLRNLKRIDLRDTNVSQLGVETLIMCCENIEHIIDTRFITCALENIISLKENSGKRFNLKSFDNTRHTPLEPKQLQLIVQMCPKIENINFDCLPPDSGRDPNFHSLEPLYYPYSLKVLNDLHDLRRLKLNHYSFYRNHLKEMLEVRGRNLVELNLRVYDMDINALTCLVQTCPNLETLYINFLFRYEEQNLSNDFKKILKPTRSFPKNLYANERKKQEETLHLKKMRFLHVDFSSMHEEQLIFMLSSCPNVESISIGLVVSVTEENKSPLKRLKESKTFRNNVTMWFIDRIVQNCNKPPIVQLYA